MRKVILGSVIAIAASACNGSGSSGPVGAAVAQITKVPSDVACIHVEVSGPASNKSYDFDVASGQPAKLTLDGLPVGSDLFSAMAYPVACNATATAQPSWVSPSYIVANVAAGGVTDVELNLVPAGSANVGINFNGDGGTTDDAGPIDVDAWPAPVDAGPPYGGNDLAPGCSCSADGDMAPICTCWPAYDMAYGPRR